MDPDLPLPLPPLPPSIALAAWALEHARESFVITDADLDRPGPRMVFVSRAFVALTGYEPAEALGRSPRFLQGPRTDRALLDRLRAQLTRGETFEGETFNYRKGGEEFRMSWYVVPLRDDGGTTTHFLAVQRDVTHERRDQVLTTAAHQLEQLDVLLSGLRHELGNPINSLKAALTMMRSHLSTYSPEQHADLLASSLAEVERVERILRAIRVFARTRAPESRPVELRALVERLTRAVGPELAGRGVTLQTTLPDGELHAHADPHALEAALRHLLANAEESLDPGTTRVIEVCLQDCSPLAVITVRDRGVGMTPEQLARTEQPFASLKPGRVGMGLATCRRLLVGMGATLRLESVAGDGTSAHVELGLAPAPPRPAEVTR